MDNVPAIVETARHPQYGTQKRVRTSRVKRADKVPFDQRSLLRVKHQSLAQEAGVIRKEESATDSLQLYMVLRRHRVADVRTEARAAGLALAFLSDRGRKIQALAEGEAYAGPAGRSYSGVEKSRKPEREHEFLVKVLPRIVYNVTKFGSGFGRPKMIVEKVTDAVVAWLNGESYDPELALQAG